MKKMLVMMMIVAMLCGCCGCTSGSSSGSSASASSGGSSPSPVRESEESLPQEESEPEFESELETEFELESESEPESEYDLDDPYAMLLCNEELVNFIAQGVSQTQQFMAMIYLKRGDRYYSISGYIPADAARHFNVGQPCQVFGREMGYLYSLVDTRSRTQCAMGDVPVLRLEPGDEVIMYSNSKKNVSLLSAEFLGYTFAHYTYSGRLAVVNSMDDYFDIGGKYEITSLDGASWKETDNLEHGAEYILSWTEGTTLNERRVFANARRYHNGYSGAASLLHGITVPGDPTTEGYAVLDFSAVPSGLYYIGGGGYIEIP